MIRIATGKFSYFMAILACCLPFVSGPAMAERIKDLASVQGIRNNQLVGYGLVVGLDGTGDQTTQTPFTTQSIINMLAQLGTTLPTTQSLQLKNVAAVMITTNLPPFARVGQQIDVTVSSMGNAKSLRGGTLIMTPLKGADGQIYAQAQGNLMVGGAGASSGGSKAVVNHLLAGRISGGATVEREVPTALGDGPFVHYEMSTTDFGTTQRVVEAINRNVTIESCAVAHGALSVVVNTEQQVSQPNALAGGQTVTTAQSDIAITQGGGALMSVKAGANLAEVIKAINALGANPQDLVSILQAMKAAGALRAELEVI